MEIRTPSDASLGTSEAEDEDEEVAATSPATGSSTTSIMSSSSSSLENLTPEELSTDRIRHALSVLAATPSVWKGMLVSDPEFEVLSPSVLTVSRAEKHEVRIFLGSVDSSMKGAGHVMIWRRWGDDDLPALDHSLISLLSSTTMVVADDLMVL